MNNLFILFVVGVLISTSTGLTGGRSVLNRRQSTYDSDESTDIGATSEDQDSDTSDELSEESEEEELKELVAAKSRRGFETCNALHDSCGFKPCCGDYVCYWADGYSITTKGVCVTCVQNGQKCQRDAQCCGGLVCHKGKRLYVDGDCGPKRRTGQECHDDDQCISGDCNTTWKQSLQGYGGSCA